MFYISIEEAVASLYKDRLKGPTIVEVADDFANVAMYSISLNNTLHKVYENKQGVSRRVMPLYIKE